MNKALHTLEVANDLSLTTGLPVGEIIIKLTAYEMTPKQIIAENRELEAANFGGMYDGEELFL